MTLGDRSAAPSGRGLALLGLGWLALACTPRVSASIVVSEPAEPKPEPEAASDEAKPERAPGDRIPPQVLRVELVSEGMLRIHFSEPIGSLDGFDPNDFSISVLNIEYDYNNYGYGYGPTPYAPSPGSTTDSASYSDFGYDYYGEALRFAEFRVHEAELTLMFTPPIGPEACRMVSYGSYGPYSSTGLFLHYAASSIPIRDRQGYPLANFGADWVRYRRGGAAGPGAYTLELSGSAIDHAGEQLVPVSCSPQLPPGPR